MVRDVEIHAAVVDLQQRRNRFAAVTWIEVDAQQVGAFGLTGDGGVADRVRSGFGSTLAPRKVAVMSDCCRRTVRAGALDQCWPERQVRPRSLVVRLKQLGNPLLVAVLSRRRSRCDAPRRWAAASQQRPDRKLYAPSVIVVDPPAARRFHARRGMLRIHHR
jgi:hypothetical protein